PIRCRPAEPGGRAAHPQSEGSAWPRGREGAGSLHRRGQSGPFLRREGASVALFMLYNPRLSRFPESAMPRVCQVTGKKPMKGHLVSHANNKTIRTFEPNLHYRRFWVESQNRWVRLRVSTAGLRRIDKLGVEAVLAEIKARSKVKG